MNPLSPLTFRPMGRAELRDAEGRTVALPTRRTMLVLAMLALGPPEGWRRAELAAAVWEGAEPKSAREGLRTALTALRKRLPEGAIVASGDGIRLIEGAVRVGLEGDEEAGFMAGFESEWTIDHRIRLRAFAVGRALEAARTAKDGEEALAHAERACRIDALDAEAASLKDELLRAAGRLVQAQSAGARFRARVVRELGTLPERAEPLSEPAEHPLMAAAEWSLARDPAEACALIAGTQSQWTTMAVGRALSMHERVLAATRRPSRERRIVEAGRLFLLTLNGRAGGRREEIEAAYQAAMADGEAGIARSLGEAIAYAHLSAGDFPAALRAAGSVRAMAGTRDEGVAIAEAETMLAIVERHAGMEEASRARLTRANERMQDAGSPLAIANQRVVYASALLEQGQVDRAAAMAEWCTRTIATYASARNRPWALMLEADIQEWLGDLAGAASTLETLRETAPDAGQAAVALADDSLLRVVCRLGELDRAADALARVVTYRRRMGTVASRFERARVRPAIRTLRERLSEADLRAAFGRAARSA